ncbi:MAG: hypothetical protein IPH57_01560 [Saprospiraceae bacterium]|nr:hypothetical protein [Saprospiraceae bacterium]
MKFYTFKILLKRIHCIFLFLFLLTSWNITFSQNQDLCGCDDRYLILKPRGCTIDNKKISEFISKNQFTIKTITNKSEIASLCLNISKAYSCIGNTDSSSIYLNLAIKNDSCWVFEIITKSLEILKNDKTIFKFFEGPYFNFDGINIITKENELLKIQNIEFSNELKIIGTKDQYYRIHTRDSSAFKLLQPELDLKNRIKLDSLYQAFGFPSIKKVGIHGFNSAWIVLHHSRDCNWNKKWFLKFIENYDIELFDIESLSRTYARNCSCSGFCEESPGIVDNSILDKFPVIDSIIKNIVIILRKYKWI